MLIVAHVAFRAWAVLPAYFYLDDYRLVDEAGREPLRRLLLEPYDAQVMPFGRVAAWLAARPDQMSWPLLATMSLLMAAMAAVACLWMLITLFGWRRRTLALLALYLTTAMTLPAFMWWAAGLNQLPLQTVFFVAVGSWVRYLRGEGRRWLVIVLMALVLGLACYVKTLFVFPTLAWIAVAHFASGGPWARTATVVRQHWPIVLAALAGGVGYLAFYLHTAPQIATSEQSTGAGELAGQMLGSSFATALVGGPWRWDAQIAPVGQADPPVVLVVLSWAVVALTIGLVALRRERTGRAWVLLLAYVSADFVLLLTTRAQVVGAVSGTEYRYLTDAMCAVVLALGLATMELRGAAEGSRSRRAEHSRWRTPVGALAVVVCASALWSSVGYARIWHDDHPGKRFFARALDDLSETERADQGRVDLANQYLSQRVTGALDLRYSSSDVLLPLLSAVPRFPTVTDQLHLLTENGAVVPATIDAATTTVPGPVTGCGWLIRGSASRDLGLVGPAIHRTWWLRIDYLASNDSGLTVTAGETTEVANLHRGLHELWVRVDDGFDHVRLGGVDDGVTVCVDRVTVGEPVVEEGR